MGMDYAYRRGRYDMRRSELLSIIGESCVKCGSKDGIEFDHIDRSSKEFAIMSRWDASMKILLPELAKCQPLCATCHAKKTEKELSVEHGGGTSGRRGCKCGPCKARKAEYMRQYKKRKVS